MARLSELPLVMKRVGVWTFLKRIYHETIDDNVFTMSAAVAFYWLLALFPMLIFLLTLTPLLPTDMQQAAIERIKEWLAGTLPESSAQTILRNVEVVLQRPRGGLLSIGLIFTLWAASAGMNATMAALDMCYDLRKRRHFVVQRGVAVLLTIFCVIATLLVVLLVPVGSILVALVDDWLTFDDSPAWLANIASPGKILLFNVVRYTIGVTVLIVMVSAIFQFGVSIRRRWTLVTPGAVFSVAAVIALMIGFNAYVQYFGQASYDRTYGTLAGVMILLLMFYLISVAVLIGAEINSEIDFAMLGIHDQQADKAADPLPELHPKRKEDLEHFGERLKHIRDLK